MISLELHKIMLDDEVEVLAATDFESLIVEYEVIDEVIDEQRMVILEMLQLVEVEDEVDDLAIKRDEADETEQLL